MEDYEKIKNYLIAKRGGDLSALKDAFGLCVATDDHASNKTVRNLALKIARESGGSDAADLYWKTILFDAPLDFDCFMRYLERNRPIQEQYWLPRREKLMPICASLQNMVDGDLNELFLSLPPRTGKTTLIMMFLAWIMGRNSELSNLYCSYTDSVVAVLYNGILEVLQDANTYAYYDIFPAAKIVSTNAKDLLLNLERKKRYASFTGRSLYGTLNGACDCNGFLIGDDLISGIEEAMSKDRLSAAWAKVDNNLLPRAKESAKILWIGTRWSLVDPQGRRIDLLENDEKYRNWKWKVVNTPALDEQDESNFHYLYGVGFTTDYFRKRRASFERNADMASWLAQYQGEPIERDGSVFNPDDLRYYNGVLPDGDPDRVFIAIDPSWGGGDFTAGPVCFQYGDDLFVQDVVYCDGDKRVSQPLIAHMALKYNASAVIIEATKTTAAYTEDIDQLLRDNGRRINVQSSIDHWMNTKNKSVKGKQQRIFDRAPEIRERMVFLSDGHRSKPYSMFMQNLFSFTMTGKNKNDDAPDSLCIAVNAAFFAASSKVEVFKRPY